MLQIRKYEYKCNWKELELVFNNLELALKQMPKETTVKIHTESAIHFLKLVARRIDNAQDEYREFIKSLINGGE